MKNLIQGVAMADRQDTAPATSPGVGPTPGRRARPRKRFRTALEARQWRRRVIGYAVTTIAFVLVVNALVGENGYLAAMRANRESDELRAQLRQLRERIRPSRNRSIGLKTDPSALEEAARRDLRLLLPGETMVVIKDAAKTPDGRAK
jgi:cell division protein FtsB